MAFLLCAGLAWPIRAQGQTEVTATARLVSDYRFRGVSLSGRQPALQAGVEVDHRGWFAGGWASTTRIDPVDGGEIDFYAGRRGSVAGFDYAATAYAYLFDGQPAYFEAQATLGRDLGPVTVEIELAYAPRQRDVTRANTYIGAALTAPIAGTGVALVARGGVEDSFFFGRKRDWEVGARWSKGPFTVSASMVGTDGDGPTPRDARTGLVLALGGSW